MSCKCSLCKGHRRTKRIIKSRDVDKLISLVNELEDDNLHLADDLDYYKVILNGSWPNSVKILTNALEQAKKKYAEHTATKSS